MRKILLALILTAIIIITFIIMKNGIGPLKVLGFQGLSEKNENLTNIIGEANAKKDEYKQALDKMQTDAASLSRAKKAYLDLVTVSTDSDIEQALQTKTYTIEYLWSRIGNYATKEGVVAKMEVVNSSLGTAEFKNLNFTITGSYLSLISFISDIENDSQLEFTIDNFDMTKERATFTIKDVKILEEKTESTVGGTETTTQTSTNSNTNQNTTSETNANTTSASASSTVNTDNSTSSQETNQ